MCSSNIIDKELVTSLNLENPVNRSQSHAHISRKAQFQSRRNSHLPTSVLMTLNSLENTDRQQKRFQSRILVTQMQMDVSRLGRQTQIEVLRGRWWKGRIRDIIDR